ncbi:YdiU family protein [Aliarcobacter faecis]|uniref:protein adenylyltransferase SelO n=1 Tax=Aliarcobacter faecis TaxID=1564138 RepID=UPI00047A912F|nr:YdiU family protein [Aliarcobacter faecis]QKF73777.1 YdiU family protein [Aliarcobacter faecis]
MKIDELEIENDFFRFDSSFYELVKATPLKEPRLISFSKSACDLIGLDYSECEKKEFIDFLNGKKLLKNSTPYATVYAGHQFGHFVAQLGDGRAINLGILNGYHLQTKGSGVTRYSRQGDGRAILRSSIREYLLSEAMQGLNIPTTRALAIISSKTEVSRDWKLESCAIVLRLSPSFIRVGTFEYFARTKDAKNNILKLADLLIEQVYKDLKDKDNKYELMFFELVDRSAKLLALWQSYGFCHGVLNTDNFSVAGLTIDYGPYAFMDYFEHDYICNHTDYEGRYSYKNQPYIARWNLLVLADSLTEICNYENLKNYMKNFLPIFEKEFLSFMSKRVGLDCNKSADSNFTLIFELQNALQSSKIDYNYFFYCLTNLKSFSNINEILEFCKNPTALKSWFSKYEKVCLEQNSSFDARLEIMKKVNPKYILKNYIIEEAIKKAQNNDFSLVNDLLKIAQNPFDEHKDFERYSKPTPQQFSNIKLSCLS